MSNLLGINTTALSGAIDVIVVQSADGSLTSTPFHVRYAAYKTLRAFDKVVAISVNGEEVPEVRMKLGHAGEAFFVQEAPADTEVPRDQLTTPIVSPSVSPAEKVPQTPMGDFHLDSDDTIFSSDDVDSEQDQSGYTSGPTSDQEAEPEDIVSPSSPLSEKGGSPRNRKVKTWTWGWGELPAKKREKEVADESQHVEEGTDTQDSTVIPVAAPDEAQVRQLQAAELEGVWGPFELPVPTEGLPALVKRPAKPTTTLRKVATTSRSGDVWVADKCQVRDGDQVLLLRIEASQQHDLSTFGWVRVATGTEGYVQMRYLTPLEEEVPAQNPNDDLADEKVGWIGYLFGFGRKGKDGAEEQAGQEAEGTEGSAAPLESLAKDGAAADDESVVVGLDDDSHMEAALAAMETCSSPDTHDRSRAFGGSFSGSFSDGRLWASSFGSAADLSEQLALQLEGIQEEDVGSPSPDKVCRQLPLRTEAKCVGEAQDEGQASLRADTTTEDPLDAAFEAQYAEQTEGSLSPSSSVAPPSSSARPDLSVVTTDATAQRDPAIFHTPLPSSTPARTDSAASSAAPLASPAGTEAIQASSAALTPQPTPNRDIPSQDNVDGDRALDLARTYTAEAGPLSEAGAPHSSELGLPRLYSAEEGPSEEVGLAATPSTPLGLASSLSSIGIEGRERQESFQSVGDPGEWRPERTVSFKSHIDGIHAYDADRPSSAPEPRESESSHEGFRSSLDDLESESKAGLGQRFKSCLDMQEMRGEQLPSVSRQSSLDSSRPESPNVLGDDAEDRQGPGNAVASGGFLAEGEQLGRPFDIHNLTQGGRPRLSLCGTALRDSAATEASPQAQQEIFESHIVDWQAFQANPGLVSDPDLIVELGTSAQRFYSWQIAAPMILAALCFDQELSPAALQSAVQSDEQQQGGWLFWPFRRGKTNKPYTSPSLGPVAAAEDEPPPPPEMEEFKPPLPPPTKQGVKSLYPTSQQLQAMHLKPGQNTISFTIGRDRTTVLDGFVYLWPSDAKIVISDVDGTVTRSDVLGHILPNLGRDWSHAGVSRLFNEITKNGYHLMYLTSRALGQASMTRDYLQWVQQDGQPLPPGPVCMSPDGLIRALTREVILRRPMDFKIACLRDIEKIFPKGGASPFYAGFGNRGTDVISYEAVEVPQAKIFIINPQGEIQVATNLNAKLNYHSLVEDVDSIFPPVESWQFLPTATNATSAEQVPVAVPQVFNASNFWSNPNPYANVDVEDLLDD